MSWWETLHLVTWWKRLGISAIKTGQDAPSWIWCTERLSFFGGGHIVLQRFVHVRCHFQPLPTKLVFAYFDRGSYIYKPYRLVRGTSWKNRIPEEDPWTRWSPPKHDKTTGLSKALYQRCRQSCCMYRPAFARMRPCGWRKRCCFVTCLM